MRLISLLPLLLLSACALWRPAAAPPAAGETRLGTQVQPLHYTLELSALPEAERLSGQVAIAVQLREPASEIALHGNRLAVDSARYVTAGGAVYAGRYRQLDRHGRAVLRFAEPLPAGAGRIEITWTAALNTTLESLYKVREQGRDYLYSQFQISSARLLFPGFDEPGFKTPFSIAVTTHEALAVIGNMPIAETQAVGGGLKRVRFQTTPPLPTYLLALAIGPFDVVEGRPVAAGPLARPPVPLRGITVAGQGDRIRPALDQAAELLPPLEAYFGIPYPYPKLDLIAAPDFNFGAMENVGAIVYRDEYLLLDEDSPSRLRQFQPLIQAHELAHQWFGNLVTPRWWDDIWLNESFASWMAAKVAQDWNPAGGYAREVQREALDAMSLDALASTRQIRQPINSHDDMANAFDGITYDKGGGVLQMFEAYLGAAAFRDGVREHFRRHAGGNADADAFMESLAAGSGEPGVVPAFRSFIEQPGVPEVELVLECGDENQVRLRQRRHAPLGSAIETGRQWQIPLCLRSFGVRAQGRHCLLLEQAEQILPLDSCPLALMPNADGAGYYRWTLSDSGWRALILSVGRLNAAEALSLADSVLAAFRAGKADFASVAATAGLLAAHPEWDVAAFLLKPLAGLLERELQSAADRQAMREWLRRTWRGRLEQIGLDGLSTADRADPMGTALLRRTLISGLALGARDPGLREELMQRALLWVGDPAAPRFASEEMPADLVSAALTVALQNGDPAYGRALIGQLGGIGDAVLRRQVIVAASRTPALAAEMRALILSPTLRDNEIRRVLSAQFDDADLRADAWDWLRANFDAVVARTADWSRGALIRHAAAFCSSARAAEIESFFRPRLASLSGGPRVLEQTLESVALCVALREARGEEMSRFLRRGATPVMAAELRR